MLTPRSLVFVFKDFSRQPLHCNTIPVESLEGVKNWLDGTAIAFTEGPLNLNWSTIMKTVNADPLQFFKDGGWSFLNSQSDSEDSEEEEDEDSAFEMSEEELEASESTSQEASEFDDDEDASADEGSAAGSDELSEDGEDWDELERKAKKADRETGVEDGDRGGRGGGKPNGVKRKR